MKRAVVWKIIGAAAVALLLGVVLWNAGLHVHAVKEPITARPSDCTGDLRFAVIGDFGEAGQPEADVAALTSAWDVDLIVTVGDNNYPHGEASTIDQNIGQYFQAYIRPYVGSYGPGAAENGFWPALGNHEWDTGTIQAHLDYFDLPGNERYYEFVSGPVDFFILDSDPNEPDGRRRDSVQAAWLEKRLADSSTPWQLVFLHHPPFASALGRAKDREMQWPYARWGADAVVAGHNHFYERLHYNGIPYFVNGLGGKWTGWNPIHRFWLPLPGSRIRYNRDYGAMLVTASETCLNLSFSVRDGQLIDSHTQLKEKDS